MSEHTPSTPDVEMRYIRFRQLEADIGADGVTPHQPGEFKRWYEAEVRQAKAEALRDMGKQFEIASGLGTGERDMIAAQFCYDRADQIERVA